MNTSKNIKDKLNIFDNYVSNSPRIIDFLLKFKKFNNYFHSFHFNPVAGRLLVFPSHLEHHVDFNESQEDRISVSFNVRLEE